VLPRLWTPMRRRWWSVLSSPGGEDQLYSDRGTPDGSGLPGIRLSGLRGAALELCSGYDPRHCLSRDCHLGRAGIRCCDARGAYTGTLVDPRRRLRLGTRPEELHLMRTSAPDRHEEAVLFAPGKAPANREYRRAPGADEPEP